MSDYGRSHGRRADWAGSFRKESPASQPRRVSDFLAADVAKNKQLFAEVERRGKEKRAFELYEQELTPIERGNRQEQEARKRDGTGGFDWSLDKAMKRRAAENVRAARVAIARRAENARVARHSAGQVRLVDYSSSDDESGSGS